MLRFFTLIARPHAFDDTSLDAHALFGQALLADLLYQALDHVLPPGSRNQTQRDQTFIHDADGLGKADLDGRDLSLLCRLQHQGADNTMGQQKRIDLLNDAFWSQTAQSSSREAQVGTGLIDNDFDVPALMIQDGHLFGWVEEGIKQGGHQSIDLLSGSWNAWIGEGVGQYCSNKNTSSLE